MKANFFLFFILIILIGVFFTGCPAQGDSSGEGASSPSTYSAVGLYDTTFNNGNFGADMGVDVIATQSDGKVLIGGDFTTYNGVNIPDSIIRLNTDGTYDTTFNAGGSGTNGTVYAIAVQSDGKFLIGGTFTTYNGVNVPDDIIRLNTDGTYDTTFNTGGFGADVQIQGIAVQSDGKILIGGWFTAYNGVNVPDYIIRLNTDGTHDTTFNTGGSGADSAVYPIAIQTDGQILIGGNFTAYNGFNMPDRIIRLNTDGSCDTTFNTGGAGADGAASTIAVQVDGKFLIGGNFTTYNGVNVPDNIIRLNASGTCDTTFNTGGSGADGQIRGIAVQSDGKILIAGEVTTYNGVNIPVSIIRLNTNGTYDTTFNTGGAGASMGWIRALALQPDGKILIGGSFPFYNGNDVPDRIIRLY